MSASQDQLKAAADRMRFLELRPSAQVTWNVRSLVVEAAGQVLRERPTVWANVYKVIYHP